MEDPKHFAAAGHPHTPPPLRGTSPDKGRQISLVELGDLGEQDEMKAIGLFAHKGVANHPGDAGMAAMAERIYDAIKRM